MRRIPRYASSFVGRRAELGAITATLGAGALVTLVGTAGVGKTRLACEAAGRLGVPTVFVDGATASGPDDLAVALLRDLGARPDRLPGETLRAAAGRELSASGAALCVVDNLEQLGPAAAAAIAEWRTQAGGVSWLATSRAPLGAPGESVVEVEPLRTTGDARDAVELFLRALPPLRAGLEREDHVDRVRRIVQRLDGLPLAIELAAGRAAVLPIDEIERRLDAPLALLADPDRPADRTSQLSSSVRWSWDLLPPEVAATLAQCAVFAGPFDLDAARAVVSVPGDLAEHLRGLVTARLLRVDPDERFVPYEVVRAFARTQLGDALDVRRRHAAYFARTVVGAPWARLERDAVEVEAAMAAAACGDLELVASARRAMDAATPWFLVRRSPEERIAAVERLAAAGPETEDLLGPLHLAATSWSLLGDFDRAAETGERCLRLARATGHRSGELYALGHLGDVAHSRHDLDGVEEHHRRALALARELGQRDAEVYILCGALIVRPLGEGRLDEVEALILAALEVARQASPAAFERVHWSLVEVAIARGELEKARTFHAEVVRLQALHGPPPPVRIAVEAYLGATIELVARGGGAVEVLRTALGRTTEWARADTRALVTLWAALAEAMDRRPEAMATLALARERAGRGGAARTVYLVDVAARCVAALAGAPAPPEVEAWPEPSARALHALAGLVVGVVAGTLDPDAAERDADAVGPRNTAWWVLRRAVTEAAERRRAEARTWRIASDGSWFAPPGGEAVSLAHRPTLTRVARALAEAKGPLGVDAIFAAGWPGEEALARSAGNRVRVAVTTLRQLGLTGLAWTRDSGWYLDAPVRVEPLEPPRL